jgi:hypothetical protein
MKQINRRIATGLALIAFVVAALVASPQQGETGDKDPAKKLIEKSVKAMGGEKKAASWKTRTETGKLTVHWPGWGTPKAVATRYVKRPDKMVLDQDFSAFDHPFFFTYYYNEGDVWANVNMGIRQNPRYTAFMTRAMKSTGGMYYFMAECDTFYLVGDVPDDSLITGADVDRVGIVDDGDTVLVDLDKKTHLPVRQIENGGSQHVLFADYRATGGLKVPFRLTVYQNGAVSAEYVWEEIKFDEPVDDKMFEKDRPAKQASG